MGKIPILFKDRNRSGNEPKMSEKFYSLARPLPVFCLLEYSVLGLLVDMPETAIRVLAGNGYPVAEDDFGAEVTIDHARQLREMVQLLRVQGIDCEVGNVVDHVYQG